MKSLQQGPKDERIPWSTVAEYTEQWTWPKGSLKVAHLFSENAVRKHKKAACFMASASELLTLVPVFMCFFQRIGTRLRSHAGKIGSILLVLQVVWLLQSVRRGLVPPDLLMASILDHLNAFLTEYGEDPWKPKHHYSIHLAWMLAAKRQLVACFVTERKHRQIKRFTRLRQNTKSFEVGTAEDLTIQHSKTSSTLIGRARCRTRGSRTRGNLAPCVRRSQASMTSRWQGAPCARARGCTGATWSITRASAAGLVARFSRTCSLQAARHTPLSLNGSRSRKTRAPRGRPSACLTHRQS